MNKTIYLVSASPRRLELLQLTGLDFIVHPLTAFDEDRVIAEYEGDVIDMAGFIAREKAMAALDLDIYGILITSDTLVISEDGLVLGKPVDDNEAEMFLDRLAGNWHTVATGVAVVEKLPDGSSGEIYSLVEKTRVKFAPMTDAEISAYIATGEPFDKAGGYGIQGRASVHIEKIEGCYFNVVGFPLHAFWTLWKKHFIE